MQHIAFQLESETALLQAKEDFEAAGIEVLGPTDHGIIKSIYLFDPNGHPLELTTTTASAEELQRLDAVKWEMLEEWIQTKKVSHKAQ